MTGTRAVMIGGVLVMTLGCSDRRDAADLAVGIAPFEELRGINVAALRSGGVRAFRKQAQPAPFEGLRETIGSFDVLYALVGFDGSDGAWPDEDAPVQYIEASRGWPSDSSALLAWRSALREIKAGLAVDASCVRLEGPGFSLLVAEWDRGEGWSLSASLARASIMGKDTLLSARHSIAVRRQALSRQFPEASAANPDKLPTWTRSACAPEST
ncbi:MAG: hypothetical protein IT357_03605 [Gemmatimonadaceae bacterium]|nr:hypothetical protein [Gemmatimonadaceae bacterium]